MKDEELLKNIKNDLPKLTVLLKRVSEESEDLVYRFYHQSFKVYGIQSLTDTVVKVLRGLLPDTELNEFFVKIVRDGTGREYKLEDNKNWQDVTRPLLEAFFHARCFLEAAVKCGEELDLPPKVLPSKWALLLYLYNLR